MTTDVAAATQDAETATSLRDTVSGNGWVADGLSANGSMAALDATIRPIDMLPAAGLDFLTSYVQPLQDVVDRMAGKSAAIQTFADGWQRAATAVEQVQQQLGQAVTAGTAQWQGTAGDAYRGRATEITAALQGASALATATGAAARTMGAATASARQQAGDLVTDLVQRLISYVGQAKAAQGGLTPTVMSQATQLINSYQAPVTDIEQQLRQTVSKAQQQVDGTVQVASVATPAIGSSILGTWNALQQRLDNPLQPVGEIIQLPPPPLPPDARPASKAELDRIAQNPIFYGKLGYRVTVGEYAEAAALQALGLNKNTTKFKPYEYSTNPSDWNKGVIPDAVMPSNSIIIDPQQGTIETHSLPNGTMVDIKATSAPITSSDEQFTKYVDYLSQNYAAAARTDPDTPKPTLVYVGTSETQISQGALDYASRNNVEVWRSQMYLSGPDTDPRISVGPPQSLTDVDNPAPILHSANPPQQAVPLFNTPYDELLRRQNLKDEQN